MNTQSILARVNAIAAAVLEDHTITFDGSRELEALRADLEAQLRQECASAKGTGNAVKVISRILNAAKKDNAHRPLHYAWIDADGKQCVCDGYIAFRLNDPLPLEPRPADAGEPIALDKIIPSSLQEYHLIATPSTADVKAHIALERAKSKRRDAVLFDLGEGFPVVNASYLLDLLTVLPDAEMHVKEGSAGLFAPLYAKGANGEAILCPIRVARKTAAQQVEEDRQAIERERRNGAQAILDDYVKALERDPDAAMDFWKLERLAEYGCEFVAA